MGILNVLKRYETSWNVKKIERLSDEEIQSLDSAVVVDSDYGYSVKFVFLTGGCTYIPCGKEETLSLGQVIQGDDLKKLKVLTLEKAGEHDIMRCEYDQ